ncbi:MAG: hypothetical protein KGM42_02150 [Hyphomicrobiales bacterium]|nr:hypothetical protein [Hyphomicrobiales bacterium]
MTAPAPMTASTVADLIVDACGIVGLVVAIAIVRRRDPRAASTRFVRLALWLTAFLFALRDGAWTTGSDILDRASVACAALFPLGVLLATESTLRRHAPRALKMFASAGVALFAVNVLAGLDDRLPGFYVLLPAFQAAVLIICATLLVQGADEALSTAERKSVSRIGWAIVIAAPFALTDFRSLVPDAPVRLGALGALLAITYWLADSASVARQRSLALLSVRLAAGVALGAAASLLRSDNGAADLVRLCAVAVAGVLATGLVVDLVDDIFAARSSGLLASLADAVVGTRDEMVAALRRQPLFEAAQRRDETALADFDPDILRAAFARRRVWRLGDRPWGLAASDPVAERIESLLATCQATHVVAMATQPLDILTIALPPVATDPEAETAIRILGRILGSDVRTP